MCSWNMSSTGPSGAPSQGDNINFGQTPQQQPRMHSGHSYSGGPLSDNTPTLNHLLQSSPDPRHKQHSAGDQGGGVSSVGSYPRDDYSTMNPGGKGEPSSSYDSSQSMYMSPMHHQQQLAGWGSHPRGGANVGHQYMSYPQGPGPGSSMYPNQPGGGTSSDMSQGRRPPMGGSPYPQPGSQYMGGQQMAMGPGPNRFMMPGQMPNQMYNQSQMYMPPSQPQQPPQQQSPAPSVSPAGRPLTPQLQQMQNMISNSPKQPSPAPSISSDHGSTHSSKHGEDGQENKLDSQNDSGDNSIHRGSSSQRPIPSPVGSAGSRSNTPASIPGTQSGSPMPIRPPSGQVDGHTNRMTQSPMATQGYNPGMMPPPNNMGYMPNTGKMPGHYPPYNTSQYPPQGNYSRQQSGMGGPGGMSGHMGGGYHSSQQGMYPNGPSQMQGGYGMGWNMGHSGYGPGPYPSGNNAMMGGGPQYPGYGSHMPPAPGQQQPPPHAMQQQQQQQAGGPPMVPGGGGVSSAGPMPPGSTSGPMPPSMAANQQQQGGAPMMPQHSTAGGGGGPPMNKAAQAAQAAMMAAANSSVNPRMPHSRNPMSPSRSMFGQGGGPLAQMNNMTNSPNLGSPSLQSMSNAVEQLSRSAASTTPSSMGGGMNVGGIPPSSMMSSGSIPSPGPKNSGMGGVGVGNHQMPVGMSQEANGPSSLMAGGHHPSPSPLSNADPHESLSRPNSTTTIHPVDLPTHDTASSESSSGMPSDSTSVDSGFHSSDQSDKTSDSVNTPNQIGTSPPPSSSSSSHPSVHQNGEAGRTVENISPPSSSSASRPPPGHDPKMPYMNEGGAGGAGIPLPPTPLSNNTMTAMPSTDHCVTTTASFGHPTPSVTQSIASPVTSSSSPHHHHPPPHMGGPPGGPHGMMGHGMHGPHGPPHHGMMPNGMMAAGGHMGGPHGQMHPGMGGPHNVMGGPNMNMSQNGPMMGPGGMGGGGGPPMMGPNGGMMPPGSMSNSMPPHHMGQMPHHQQMPPHAQQQQHHHQQQQQQPPMVNNHPEGDQPPPVEKKKKVKDMESSIMPRSGYPGAHYTEEPNSPGVPKSASDISKLYEMGPEQDRRAFVEAVLSYLEESGQPLTSMPCISKTPLDLYKLYYCVQEKGGFEEVTRSKKWREVCTVVNIGTSASAAFTLKKNYIRYLFNYECKYDRGGLNPGPILAQLEAQTAHKRDHKNKRVPSPGSTNSNDAFRPPSTPNLQMDGGPPYPQGMPPPPYMQNPDGNNMMMGHGGMMAGQMGPGSNMMGPSQGMMGGPGGPAMMGGPGQGPPGMGSNVPPNMMPGGPPPAPHPGYGAPSMMQQQQLHSHQMPGAPHLSAQQQQQMQQQQQPQLPPHTTNSSGPVAPVAPSVPTPNQSSGSPMPVTSDSVSVQDPFADEPNNSSSNFNTSGRGAGSGGMPPVATGASTPVPSMVSAGSGGVPPSSGGAMAAYSSSSQTAGSVTTTVASTARPSVGDATMATTRPSDTPGPPMSVGGPAAQFPFGQQFDHPDRFDQSSPSSRHPVSAPPSSMTPSPQPTASDASSNPMYQQGPRYPGPTPPPHQSMAPSQYPPYQTQGSNYPHGPQYPGYPNVPPGPYTAGPRPASSPGMFGTPTRRYPDAHDGSRDGQWSPLQRPRMQPGAPGYMSPGPPPSAMTMASFGRPSSSSHRNSPQARADGGGRYSAAAAQKLAKQSYPNLMPSSMSKKELMFPADCVEGVSIATYKRKKLNSKQLAPFEAWRLMLALKSGQLAESTWALDTLSILLYDDATHSYFSLSTLPGLLEVLTEHLRHCLMQMFSNFDDMEEGFKKPARRLLKRQNGKRVFKSMKSHTNDELDSVSASIFKEELTTDVGNKETKEIGASFRLQGPDYTLASRKGLPVKFDPTPSDATVLETKDWDLYTTFAKSKEHWLAGCGDLTEHIQTHLESDCTHRVLSHRFYRKRRRLEDDDDDEEEDDGESSSEEKSNTAEGVEMNSVDKQCGAGSASSAIAAGDSDGMNSVQEKDSLSSLNAIGGSHESGKSESATPTVASSDSSLAVKEEILSSLGGQSSSCDAVSTSNHSKLCNGLNNHTTSSSSSGGLSTGDANGVTIKTEPVDESNGEECGHNNQKENSDDSEEKKVDSDKEVSSTVVEIEGVKDCGNVGDVKPKDVVTPVVENGDLEEPKLSPMTNPAAMNGDLSDGGDQKGPVPSLCEEGEGGKKVEEEEDSSPPVLKAECMDVDMSGDTQLLEDSMGDDEAEDVPSLPINSTLNNSSSTCDVANADASMVMDTSQCEEKEVKKELLEKDQEGNLNVKTEEGEEKEKRVSGTEGLNVSKEMDVSIGLNDSYVSETEEMSASFVADLLKEDESTEEEAFQRDDPPLCVTEESRDELGRRCVCISNILRSLSCVPGNESQICKHPGMMKILGRLLLLHHSHPERPPSRKVPRGEEEEKEEPPRVYDDEHWWWDYLDQLRENALVILANICSHLHLGSFPEQLCFPLLEGLLHWVICPASVARDPLPTLSAGSALSPQRLVLEALCKLCIHETNVDLLLATPPIKRLLELFSVLVHLLADRNHQITREFSLVILSLLVQGDSSLARAIALQHPCVSVLLDFLETAEKNALTIANQQGLTALQSNPEAMGTSLDMLRRAASILLHMARVPDNRKLFVQQQNRLLNLVMSQILDKSVANILSEVLYECSQIPS